MFVKDIMSRNSIVCTEDTPLAEVYQIMQETGCDYAAVVESRAHRTPIGIITEHDICFQIIAKGRDPRGLTAANVMNTNVVKALYTASLTDCSEMMSINQAKRAFIVDENGMFCGTLSNFDIETNQNKQYIEDLASRALSKENQTSRINRIF